MKQVDFGNYRISALLETLQLCFIDSFRVQQQQQFLSVYLKLQHLRPSLDGDDRSSVQYIPRNIRIFGIKHSGAQYLYAPLQLNPRQCISIFTRILIPGLFCSTAKFPN